MPRTKDVLINSIGDIEVGYNGDIACCYDDDVLVESIIFRLKTYAGDYELEPACGASLEDFIGEPNTAELGDSVRTRVVAALTHDGLIDDHRLEVQVAPLSSTQLVISVSVSGTRGTFTILSSLDLLTGRLQVSPQQ